MENLNELKLTSLSMEEVEDTNGGIIPAIYGAYLAHKAYVAMYGAAKVYGFYAGTAAAVYVATE